MVFLLMSEFIKEYTGTDFVDYIATVPYFMDWLGGVLNKHVL